MNRYLYYLSLASICTVVTNIRAQDHVFGVKDDIEMVRFSDPSASDKGTVAKVSPDGKYFAVVTSRGIIKSDQTESSLSIFRTSELHDFVAASGSDSAPSPRTILTMAAQLTDEQSDTYGAVITDIRWSANSRAIYFLAETTHGDRRLYRASVENNRAVALTPKGYHVARFDFGKDVAVYSAWRSHRQGKASEQDEDDRINADARAVTGERLKNILFPDSQPAAVDRELWVVRDKRGDPVATRLPYPPQRDISWLPEAFTISPNRHMMIELQPVTDVPTDWSLYEPGKGYEYLRIHRDDPNIVAADNILRLKQYSLVDLDGRAGVALVQAPHDFALAYGTDSKVVWSSDERRVIVTNTFLPLDGVDERERAKRVKPCAVADVLLPSLRAHCVVFAQDLATGGPGRVSVVTISFGGNDNTVMLRVRVPQGRDEDRRYVYKSGNWSLASTNASAVEQDHSKNEGTPRDRDLNVTVKQGLNEPPTLWATSLRTERSRKLWDPNPQFAHLRFGVATVYRWKDESGYEWKGGLVKPVEYVPGKRYPLVIQVYDFDETQFLTDGVFPSAMAARALANAGMVVLQLQRKLPHSFDDAEVQAHIEAFRSAIETLSSEGLVDPGKVGLVGFSASSWYIEDALIRDPKRFAAATIAEGIDISYMQYRLWGVTDPALAGEFEKIIGSKPIGDGLKQWLKLAPGFHLDQVLAPLRIEAMTPSSVLGEWEIYSSLKQQGKPVDLIYFPQGQHVHQRPLERMESQQGDVDWFRFWLQGYEDPDPSKRHQYKRWEEMKALNGTTSGAAK